MSRPIFTEHLKAKYEKDGFLVVENFLAPSEVEELKSACHKLLQKIDPNEDKTVFTTAQDDTKGRNTYFAESVDKIRHFYEPDAVDSNGSLVTPVEVSINKTGHALHWLEPAFRRHTFSEPVKSFVRGLGMVKPVVPQSMYIFKNAGIGGEVKPHQDGSFLHLEPLKLMGLWIALDDVTLDNGCLWFVPGSHRGSLNARFIRNPDPDASPMFIYKQTNDTCYDDSQYVPVTMLKGSCVFIHGLVVHKSNKNTSSKPRHAYTFHVVDWDGTKWAHDNWLQPTPAYAFPSLYDNC